MASGQVGRLSVRVLPDTSNFNRDLKKVLDRAEKRVKATIQVDLEVTRSSLANLKRQLDGIKAVVPVMAGLDSEAKRKIKDEIEDIAATVKATVDVDSAASSARLAYATRPRFVEIIARVNESSLATVASTLAALSGARVLGDLGTNLRDMAENIDRSLPRVAALTTTITALSAAALSGVSNLFAIGASLASIVPSALVLPGLFAGFAAGIGALITVMQDMGTVLADLGPQFSTLQSQMSGNFWSAAEGPIRNMVDNLFPAFSAGMQTISTDLGGFMAALSGALSSSLGGGTLAALFAPLGESIRITSDALAPLVQGIVNLGGAGGSYLPQLATWFLEISESFKTWTETADISGMIDAGIVALQDLGRVLSNSGGILAGFASAAEAAGGASLGMLADGLGRVNDAINGPIWQGALTTVFEGAHAAMAALGPGVSALGDAFVSLAPTLATIMELAGQIGSVALTAISDAFQQPAFQGGIVALFEGILAGVQALAPALPAIGEAFGAIASFAGTLAESLGGVLGAAFATIAPAITTLVTALQPLIPVLGDALVAAITTLAPLFTSIVDVIAILAAAVVPLIPAFTGLVAALQPLAVVIGEYMVSAMTALQPLFAALPGIIGQLVGAVTPLIPMFVALVAAITPVVTTLISALVPVILQLVEALLPPFMAVLGAIIGVLPALISLFTMVATTAAQILAAVAPLVVQLVGLLAPILTQLVSTILPMVVTMFQAILPPILGFVAVLIGTLIPVVQALLPIIQVVFQTIATVIQGVMSVIQGIIQVVMGIISGNWSMVWDGIVSILEGVWTIMQGVVNGVINAILAIITGVLGLISQTWNAIWSQVSGFLEDTWSSIAGAVQAGVDTVVGWVQSLGDQILSFLGGIPGQAASIGTNIMSSLAGAISNAGGMVMDAIGGAVNGAIDFAKGLLGIASPSKVFTEIGEYTGDGLAKGIESRVTAVQRATTRLVPTASAVTPEIVDGEVTDGAGGSDARLVAALQQALSGMELTLDGRTAIGALKQHRAWAGAS